MPCHSLLLETPDYTTPALPLSNFWTVFNDLCLRLAMTDFLSLRRSKVFLLFWRSEVHSRISLPIMVYQPLVITVSRRHKSKSQEKYFPPRNHLIFSAKALNRRDLSENGSLSPANCRDIQTFLPNTGAASGGRRGTKKISSISFSVT